MTIENFKMKLGLGTMLIEMLQQDDDPRAPRAIEELQRQQRRINEVLVQAIKEERAAQGEPEPPPVIVGLKAARLSARALRG